MVDLPKTPWDHETAQRIIWFASAAEPTAPFVLVQGRQVTNPAQFWQALREDISRGPDGARAKSGALQRDLGLIEALFAPQGADQEEKPSSVLQEGALKSANGESHRLPPKPEKTEQPARNNDALNGVRRPARAPR